LTGTDLPPAKKQPTEIMPADDAALLADPEELLGSRGLTKNNEFWLLTTDDELKEPTLAFAELAETDQAAEAAVVQMVERIKGLKEDQSAAARKGNKDEVETLRHQLQEAGRGHREVLQLYVQAHAELTAAYVSTMTQATKLEDQYGELQEDPAVTTALRRLGAPNRLGPSAAFRNRCGKIAPWKEKLLGDQVPIYWSEQEPSVYYVPAVLNERAAVVFAVRAKAPFNVLPESDLKDAGIPWPVDAPADFLAPSNPIRKVTLTSLRIGAYVARDVSAQVPPADAQPLEPVLAPQAFPGVKFQATFGQGVLSVITQEPPQ
jgi:hypothetical protein